MNKEQKSVLARIIITLAALVVLSFLKVKGFANAVLYLIPYFIIGYDILKEAFEGILKKKVFDEDFLMAVATIGAMLLGEYEEGVAVMLFFQIGELFQSYAVGKSRKNIAELMDIRPDYANIIKDGAIQKVDPNEVAAGSIIVVQPGEKNPIDGIVYEGESTVNTSALTGENIPRSIKAGDEIISGFVNMTGVLKIKTTKEFGESTVSKVLKLVEDASRKKSRSEDFITKFARYYTPAVCCGALALAIIPPLARMIFMGLSPEFAVWIYRTLTFLVISCPCALVISIPLSFFAGIGGAGRAGILVKGSNYMEDMSKAEYVLFDKTGTLTKGIFKVIGIHHNEISDQKILEYAAHAEAFSSHPISKSIIEAYGMTPDIKRVTDVTEISGSGVMAKVDGVPVAAGNAKLMEKEGIEYIGCHEEGTIVHVAIGGKYQGHILIADIVKPTAKKAVETLRKAGVKRVIMLTGDVEKTAKSVASGLAIDELYSGLLPADKVEKVESLLSEKSKKGKLIFVGDGINDAPVLSRADIGIAMGAMGSDAAIEAADVVLMDDDPAKVAKAVRIAKKCMRIVYENIYFAIGVKFICLILGAFGIANMWLAVFADVGVMVIAVINAIRALSVKRL